MRKKWILRSVFSVFFTGFSWSLWDFKNFSSSIDRAILKNEPAIHVNDYTFKQQSTLFVNYKKVVNSVPHYSKKVCTNTRIKHTLFFFFSFAYRHNDNNSTTNIDGEVLRYLDEEKKTYAWQNAEKTKCWTFVKFKKNRSSECACAFECWLLARALEIFSSGCMFHK